MRSNRWLAESGMPFIIDTLLFCYFGFLDSAKPEITLCLVMLLMICNDQCWIENRAKDKITVCQIETESKK
jgi:hypothetical protein